MKPIIVFNHTLHKVMWNWIAENPRSTKQSWVIKEGHKHLNTKDKWNLNIHSNCFACVACKRKQITALMKSRHGLACEDLCPLDWGNTVTCFEYPGLYNIYKMLYEEFLDSNVDYKIDILLEGISRTAKQIADRPIRQLKECELIVI